MKAIFAEHDLKEIFKGKTQVFIIWRLLGTREIADHLRQGCLALGLIEPVLEMAERLQPLDEIVVGLIHGLVNDRDKVEPWESLELFENQLQESEKFLRAQGISAGFKEGGAENPLG